MTPLQSQLRQLLDQVLGQDSLIRKGGTQALYFCKCGHYKRKLEVKLDPPFLAHCWVCDYASNLYGLLKTFKASKSYYDQVRRLTGDIKRNYAFSQIETTKELVLPNEFIPLSHSNNKGPEYKNAMVYLKRRGILWEDIIRYNIGICYGGEYQFHIIIPSYGQDGNLNFFIGRRYYNVNGSIPFKKPQVSMNIVGFELFVNWNDPIVLVEAAFNAMTIRRNAIPLFGKYPSEKLYETMILNKVKNVYVCLDSDAKRDAIQVSKKLLKLGIIPYIVDIKGGKDPNEIGFEKSWECINESKPLEFDDLLAYELGI